MRRHKRVQIRRLAGAYWLILQVSDGRYRDALRSVLLGADTLGELRVYWRENVLSV
jgi:hypothetical protein